MKPYNEGFLAHQQGLHPYMNNPYRVWTPEWFDFVDGWLKSQEMLDEHV